MPNQQTPSGKQAQHTEDQPTPEKHKSPDKTPDAHERDIEHGAEQYYRQEDPQAGTLKEGATPKAPGKVRRGHNAT